MISNIFLIYTQIFCIFSDNYLTNFFGTEWSFYLLNIRIKKMRCETMCEVWHMLIKLLST